MKHDLIWPCCKSENVVDVIEPYTLTSSAYNSKSGESETFIHAPHYGNECGHIFNASPPFRQI